MACHFTQFSSSLVLNSEAEASYALTLLDALRDDETTCTGMHSFDVSVLEAEDASNVLWLRDAYGDADIEAVIAFVRRLAEEIGCTGYWGFAYSESCSKPRLNEFGGGAFILNLETGRLEDRVSTVDWFETTMREINFRQRSP
ncbi:hypothetical protein XM53_17480 [Roseovarius atlanticus]|uniref:Uncharacterized protein n=1 Tax=Roseovarius atlanticus TaxID=1641875 RepID=A0A0T5NQE3_9RHOB|nr:hypothetical protein [Roseovarius atlanticus]KRS11186.1 hypothetical protein XM53_17480 [Roseovarius atlanticus]